MGASHRYHWWYIIIMFAFSASYMHAQNIGDQHKTLIITHPTKHNLESLAYLIRENILHLPADLHLKLVYHTAEQYDYLRISSYLEESPLPRPYELIALDCDILPGQLFTENDCSENFRSIFQGSDAMIFFGGPDLVPAIYGEETHLLTVVTDPYRHYWEASVLFHLLGGSQDSSFPALLSKKPEYAILGICLGMQTMNVATGGTMVQDIPAEIYQATTVEEVLGLPEAMQHRNYFTNLYPGMDLDWASFHPILPEPAATSLPFIPTAGQQPVVLSSHHQAVEQQGRDLVVLARSADGQVIEMMGHAKYPHVLGVQFHPEVSALYDPAARFRISPEDKEGWGFGPRYGEEHLNFHRSLWSTFGSWIIDNKPRPASPSSTKKPKKP